MSDEPLLPDTRRALLHRLATAQVEARAPAMVAGIVRGGRPQWFDGRGEVDGGPPGRHVGFRIGSITKTFVAVLVLRLRDEGRLDLGDPVDRHLPGTRPGDVTVAQVLAHTAGLLAEPPGQWWERTPGSLRPDLRSILGDEPVVHAAGRRFHYSNPGYGLLGALVERLRGMPWHEALAREILDPLGMSETGVGPPERHARGWAVHPWADALLPEPAEDYGPMAPAGQLWSTAADLCRWTAFLVDGDDRILAADTLEEMLRPAGPPEGDPAAGYGLGIQLLRHDGRDLCGHGGSVPGFLASAWASRADDIGAVVLCNTTAGLGVSGLATDLIGIVADREPRIPAPWRASSDPDLLEIAGPWYWGPSPVALRVRAGRELELTALGGRARATRLRPEPDGTWLGLDGYYTGERLQVVRDATGSVTHLDLGTFVFTRTPYDPDGAVPGGVDPGGWRR